MTISEHLQKADGKTLFSLEILPPLKHEGIRNIVERLQPLIDLGPAFIDVTYHREEYLYKKHPGGLLERVSTRKRPGTVGICAAIQHRLKIDAVPHIICGGFSKEDTENALIDLDFLGVDNLLIIRGDAIKSEGHFKPEENGHKYASDLLEQVLNMNAGKYLHEETIGSPTSFCTGVAGYPEKHYEAPNEASDIRMLKKKIDMGAAYILTQMFFDNEVYFRFVERCRSAGIRVPIIAGLKPITTKGQLLSIPRTFHVSLPDELVCELVEAKDNAAVRKIGIDWCIEQSKGLLKGGAPCIHYYTMSRPEACQAIIKACF